MPLSYEDIERKVSQRASILPNQPEYTYIQGKAKGRDFLIGPFASELSTDYQETVRALNLQRIEYNPLILPTKNRAEATRIMRARKLRSGMDISDTFQRVRHSI